MSLVFLKIKSKTLAQEARYIRSEEQKCKKWLEATIIDDVPIGDNIVKVLQDAGAEVKLLSCPKGRPDMTEEERTAYRENIWMYRARIRKLNSKHNPDLFFKLREHRVKVVRPEARATYLAIAYLRGKEYKDVETPRQIEFGQKLNQPNLDKIWRMVLRFGGVEETNDNKAKLEAWLNG